VWVEESKNDSKPPVKNMKKEMRAMSPLPPAQNEQRNPKCKRAGKREKTTRIKKFTKKMTEN